MLSDRLAAVRRCGQQTSLHCGELHNSTLACFRNCTQLYAAKEYFDSEPSFNWEFESVTFFRSQSTVAYEECSATHVRLLDEYHNCLQAQLVNYDAIKPWYGRLLQMASIHCVAV